MFSLILLSLFGCPSTVQECPPSQLIVVYDDLDFDGAGAPGTEHAICPRSDLRGLSTIGDDCDDTRGDTYPNALEKCDGLDNDCDEEIDENLRETKFWGDADGDGFGNADDEIERCSPLDGYVGNNDDCDDTNTMVNPGAEEICNEGIDDDCDGFADDDEHPELGNLLGNLVVSTGTLFYYDVDNDGYAGVDDFGQFCKIPDNPRFYEVAEDCDDANPRVNPGANEVCDGVDNDCDFLVDDSDDDIEGQTQFYYDADSDGAGDATISVMACTQPWFYVEDDTDCDDANEFLAAPTLWIPDADGDGYGVLDDPTLAEGPACAPTTPGFVLGTIGVDCDDADEEIYPGAVEACDGIDNDCDNLIDDDDDSVAFGRFRFYRDLDGDGEGNEDFEVLACLVPDGYINNKDDCDDLDASNFLANNEVCDGQDNNCDGLADHDDPLLDETTQITWYADFDQDGVGQDALTVTACEGPGLYVEVGGDCDDTDPTVAAIEDWAEDLDGDGYGAGPVLTECIPPGGAYVPTAKGIDCDDDAPGRHPGLFEYCGDGIDQDCDGFDPDCPIDTCVEAEALLPLTTGLHVLDVYLTSAVNDIEFTNQECTGSNTSGPDAFYVIELQPGEVVRATTEMQGNVALALLTTCGDTSSCVQGTDMTIVSGGTEQAIFQNWGNNVREYTVVIDCVGQCDGGSLELEIADASVLLPGTCDEASSTSQVYQTGTYHITGTVEGGTAAINLPVGNSCTTGGTPVPGADRVLPVTLLPGESLDATVSGPDNFALVLMSDCVDPEGTCVVGANLFGPGGAEFIDYINEDVDAQNLVLAIDCGNMSCGVFDAELVID